MPPDEDNRFQLNASDLLGAGRACEKLLDKVSQAIGAFAHPRLLVRNAKAQAKADRIALKSSLALKELEQRALSRQESELLRTQRNIEAIATIAAQSLPESADVQDFDEDWLANFFDRSKTVSNKHMQQIWASILAREALDPGAFSRKTLEIVHSLDREDAEAFTTLCRFMLCFGPMFVPIVFDPLDAIYKNEGISHSTLVELEALGLIAYSPGAHASLASDHDIVQSSYFDTILQIRFSLDQRRSIPLGVVGFTRAGHQLASLCSIEPINGFARYVIQEWAESHLDASIVDKQKGR